MSEQQQKNQADNHQGQPHRAAAVRERRLLSSLRFWILVLTSLSTALVAFVVALLLSRRFASTLLALVRRLRAVFPDEIRIPAWFFFVAGIFTLVAVIALERLMLSRFGSRSYVRGFRSENFGDVFWRWSYGKDGRARDLVAHCPECDSVLQSRDRRRSYCGAPAEHWLCCRRCGSNVAKLETSYDAAVRNAEQQIEKWIETGQWRRR
ncbi:hypothetical protein ACFLSJ_02905 [Verrucomicrobiota bacterium]